MRIPLIATALALGISAPALADTLQEVTTKGEIVTIQDFDIDVKFTPDGKFTAVDGQITGTWRTDGDKLCTTSNTEPNESCAVYPKDKKSGDTFEVTGPGGTAKVKIK
jgi:hypothetical protein